MRFKVNILLFLALTVFANHSMAQKDSIYELQPAVLDTLESVIAKYEKARSKNRSELKLVAVVQALQDQYELFVNDFTRDKSDKTYLWLVGNTDSRIVSKTGLIIPAFVSTDKDRRKTKPGFETPPIGGILIRVYLKKGVVTSIKTEVWAKNL